MRIMIDTNVLISALLFPSEKMNELFKIITFKFQYIGNSHIVHRINWLRIFSKYRKEV